MKICKNVSISIHRIGVGKLNYLLDKLKCNPDAPRDKSSRHQNCPLKLDQEIVDKIHQHIKSFKYHRSHYSFKNPIKVYLSEELNIKKIYDMFIQENSGEKTVV